MPSGPVSARLFIWYPNEDPNGDTHIGHASLYLGNYEVGKNFEISLDPRSPEYVMPSALETAFGASGVHYNQNYVSWWPEDGSFGRAEPKLGLYQDVAAERSEPHVVYDLYGLSVEKMRLRWKEIRDKPKANYNFLRKNCADVVHRVLTSGGVLGRLPLLQRGLHVNTGIMTPKRVASLADALRNAGWAIKTKAGNCPTKASSQRDAGALGPILMPLLRLR
ncbi:hypothetical protein EJV46_08155 [Roseococcus sp. SYP-B2431]|uniref:hypothetical protein n=1 Tax=Roseococcus sp. SYP-B2431 TaxID=2496640 RepID=UPI00103CD0A2|nr:hypothetical protein [Roseococcus sp. SYP-B2431]TCH98547.1 hypothetical protein EJV46_08155 [Roseococcus sp. SYP-B2431]